MERETEGQGKEGGRGERRGGKRFYSCMCSVSDSDICGGRSAFGGRAIPKVIRIEPNTNDLREWKKAAVAGDIYRWASDLTLRTGSFPSWASLRDN